jgi:hypothetical protein
MISTLKALQSDDFYGSGHYVELAKGKHELVTTWADFKIKIKRTWLLRKR